MIDIGGEPIRLATVKAGSTITQLDNGSLLVTHPDDPPYVISSLMIRPAEGVSTLTLEYTEFRARAALSSDIRQRCGKCGKPVLKAGAATVMFPCEIEACPVQLAVKPGDTLDFFDGPPPEQGEGGAG